MRIANGIAAVLIILSASSFALAEGIGDAAGKTYYTAVNIFYERPGKIVSTNYHKGRILPAGTKVTVLSIGRRSFAFTDERKTVYRMFLKRKHAAPGMTLEEYFNQYLSAADPLRPEGPWGRFTEDERWHIRNGIIEKGMSRQAVLMAYGYPPGHETPVLDEDRWTYWIGSRHGRTVHVHFRDGRVAKISGTVPRSKASMAAATNDPK